MLVLGCVSGKSTLFADRYYGLVPFVIVLNVVTGLSLTSS